MTTRTNWRDAFTGEELRALRRVSNLHGAKMIATNFGLVALALGACALWPTWYVVVPALFVIGTRQLGMAVVMHEASHGTLLANRRLNDWAGNWLAGYWVFLGVELYRPYHLQHHLHTGTEKDPDLNLRTGFPTTQRSMLRKVARDLLGIVGLKRLLGTFLLLMKAVRGRRAQTPKEVAFIGQNLERGPALRTLLGFAATQSLLFAVLYAFGQPWLFVVWAVAWLTTQNLVTRLRSIAEHAMTALDRDPFLNTRTVRTRWWERLLIAPNGVAYHLEHHLLMNVPAGNLPRFHRMLAERGLLEGACVEQGYFRLLGQVTNRPEGAAS